MNVLEIIFNLFGIKSSIPIKKIGSLDNYSTITNKLIEPIRKFESWNDFENFLNLIEIAQKNKIVYELTDKKYYYCDWCREYRFYLKECDQIWRLVYPDYPFCGLWERVKPNE